MADEVIHQDDQPSTSRSENLQEVQKPLSPLDSKSPHVAREDKVNDILHLLQTPPELPVISLVGMGGVGKTFLLQHVYTSAKQRFEKSNWLSISQRYYIAVSSHIKEWQPENMHLQDIVNGQLSVEWAAELIFRCLENAEALVVLDDVWRVDGGHDLIRNLGPPRGQNRKCKISVPMPFRIAPKIDHLIILLHQPTQLKENVKSTLGNQDCGSIHGAQNPPNGMGVEVKSDGSSSGCRRILLAKKGIDNNAIANLHFPRFLRTLSLSLNSIENIPANLFSSVRVLRVIDLSSTQISTLPKGFGNLKLLRVLNLSGTEVKEAPECVRNLKSLCFLDLSLAE